MRSLERLWCLRYFGLQVRAREIVATRLCGACIAIDPIRCQYANPSNCIFYLTNLHG